MAYDHFLPGQFQDVASKQHSVAIFIDMPKPAWVTRTIAGECHYGRLVQGDMVVVPADAWHRVEADVAAGALMLGFDSQAFARLVDEATERDGIELVPCFASTDLLVHQLGLSLKRALENSKSTSRLYAETLVAALTAHLMQYYCTNPVMLQAYSGGLPTLKLRQIVDYIQTHLSDDSGLNELAGMAQISPHYFSQLFKQSTGRSPYQYIIYCRIERARQILSETEFAIAEVAKMVGFVDQSHFHRHFKRLVGITPGKFVRQTK